jgi:hypothetical protein
VWVECVVDSIDDPIAKQVIIEALQKKVKEGKPLKDDEISDYLKNGGYSGRCYIGPLAEYFRYSHKEIAKMLRKYLRLKYGKKGYKFNVRTGWVGFTPSIDVKITKIPDSVPLFNKDFLRSEKTREFVPSFRLTRYSDEVDGVIKDIESFLNLFLVNDSAPEIDYFNRSLHYMVLVDWKLEKERYEKEIQEV